MSESLSLTLVDLLHTEIPQMLAIRDEAYEVDRECSTPETRAACDAIEQELQRYVAAEIRKVDGTADVRLLLDRLCHEPRIRKGKTERCAMDLEIDRMRERRDKFRENLKRLDSMIIFAMEEMPWKEGKPRKLEGVRHSISLRGNGGAQPVDVYDESLVPDEFCMSTMTFPAKYLKSMQNFFSEADEMGDVRFGARVPSKSLIAEALNKSCLRCDGNGVVEPWGELDEDADYRPGENPCKDCNGSGNASVPGCRLLDRVVSVVVS